MFSWFQKDDNHEHGAKRVWIVWPLVLGCTASVRVDNVNVIHFHFKRNWLGNIKATEVIIDSTEENDKRSLMAHRFLIEQGYLDMPLVRFEYFHPKGFRVPEEERRS